MPMNSSSFRVWPICTCASTTPKAPQNPHACLRGCPSPLSACQASLFVGEIMVILRTSAEPGLQDFTGTCCCESWLGAGLAVHDVLGQTELLADATRWTHSIAHPLKPKLHDLLGASAAPTDPRGKAQGSFLCLALPAECKLCEPWALLGVPMRGQPEPC